MKTLLLLLGILVSFAGFSQPPCGSNPAAGNTCATATPICELNGYCGNTSASYTADYWQIGGTSSGCGLFGLFPCPGTGLIDQFCGSIENNSFLKFVASSTSISLNVWVYNSTYGDGIQILIFSTPNCGGNVTAYYCDELAPSGAAQAVTATGLTPGNTYYIMIDGYAGDICDYTIGANTGVQIPVGVTPETSTICPGEPVALTASGGNGSYTWNASPNLNTTSGANVTATPPSPGTYTFTVSSTTGNALCPSSSSATATVIVDNCGCTVTATNSGAVCSGGTANLFATTIAGAVYSWTGPSGFTSSDQNPTSIPLPTIPGTYDYTVTATANGVSCTSTTTITVNAIPTVSAGTYPTTCINGLGVTLVGSPLGGTFSGTSVLGSIFSPLLGTQTITYNYTDANGCSNSDVVTINVSNAPSVNAGMYGPVCSDAAAITLAGTPAGGTFSGTGVTGSSFAPAAGTQTITYNYTDGVGCSGSATTTITVNPLPNVNAGTYAPACVNAPDLFLGGTPAGGTFSGTGVTGTNFDPSAGTQTITYQYTNANGCSNSATTTITVNNLPTVSAGTYSPVCVNAPDVTLTGTPAGGTFSGPGVLTTTFDPNAGTQTITYNYTDANGCSNSANATITVNPLPTITAGADQAICAGTEITLAGGGGVTYTWNPAAANNTPFAPPVGTTTYTVTGTDANGCQNTDAVTINVLPMPNAGLLAQGPVSGYPGLNVTFDNMSQFSDSWYWEFGNGSTATTNDVSQSGGSTFNTPGNYWVILTASNGLCADTAQVQVIVLPYEPLDIHIPNVFTPNGDQSNDFFFIDVKSGTSINVLIVNRWGNFVAELTDFDQQWDGRAASGEPVSEGTYFFKYLISGKDGTTQSGQSFVELVR